MAFNHLYGLFSSMFIYAHDTREINYVHRCKVKKTFDSIIYLSIRNFYNVFSKK